MGEIKVRLKRVKELIDSHEWQRAYDIVDRILGEDSGNTMARVMMGKTAIELDKPEKAIECFRFAVKSQPDSMPGWQGIIAYFNKYQPEVMANDELLEAYRRMLESIGNDEKLQVKIIEMLRGYTQQLILKGSTEGLQDALLRLIDLTGDGQAFKEARVDARQKLIRLMLPKKYEVDLRELEPSQLELLLKTFHDLLSEFDQTSLDQHFPQEHLNTLLRLDRTSDAVRVARDYCDRFGTAFAASVIYMAVLCRALQTGTVSNQDRPDWSYQDQVALEDKQHPLVRIGKAFQAFVERNYEKSADLLDKALSNAKGIPSLPAVYTTPLLTSLSVLAKKYLGVSLVCASASDESVVKGRDLLEEVKKDLKDQQVYFFLGHAQVQLADLRSAEKALNEGRKVLEGDHDAMLLLSGLEADIALTRKDYTTAEVQSEKAQLVDEKNYILHYVFFRSLWDTERRDPRRCIAHLLRSIELYPNFAINHIFLAFWKWKGEDDTEVAKEEYELAYKLQPNDPRIIRAYTDFCTINHQDERAMTILRDSLTSFLQKPEDVRWITLRLALLCYRNRLWNECVNNIRLVLRQNPDDRLVQEFLADALTFRGNYWSALGTFDSVVQMAEERKAALPEYSLYRRATLKQMLQMGEEAEEDFILLQKESSWFQDMCLISMAQIEISKAGDAFRQCIPSVGAQCCQKAVDLLTK
ncbi:hypothetical protein RvY_17386-2 [Ramazzottius varieornatus]|nr:hypothetical protein RvY_17386-2 [Ramazzottius varieornatus]